MAEKWITYTVSETVRYTHSCRVYDGEEVESAEECWAAMACEKEYYQDGDPEIEIVEWEETHGP